MLVSHYRKNGMLEKADKLMNKSINNRKLVILQFNPLLEEWGKGNQVKPSELRNVIKDLCDTKQFSKALEASSWMDKEKVFNLVSEDYGTRLKLIENVFGLHEAEKFFESSIPENMKNSFVYSTLLTLYAKSAKTQHKAEATFEKMRELGFLSSISPFNWMIYLYTLLRKPVNIANLMCEMKERNIEPETVTLNYVLRVYADEGDIETMEKYKSEWDARYDKKTKLEVSTMDAMVKAYEKAGLKLKAIEIAGNSEEVHRLWNEYKKDKKNEIGNEVDLSVIRSLLRLDDVQGAEKVYNMWKPLDLKFDTRIPGLLIGRYCEEEKYDEAKTRKLVKSVRNKRRLLHLFCFLDICVVVMAGSLAVGVVGIVPGVVWWFGGEPGTVGISLLLAIVVFLMTASSV